MSAGRRGDLVVAVRVGGLGNQLFQFAAARGAQVDAGPVIIDDREQRQWPDRLYEVLRPGTYRRATQLELLRLRQAPRLSRGQLTARSVRESLARRTPWLSNREFREASPMDFDQRIQSLARPVLLRGYFQNELYFWNSRQAIRSSFQSTPPEVLSTWARIRSGLSADHKIVGVSLRTGKDYQGFNVVLPGAFYREALRTAEARLGSIAAVIFGDVPADCARFAAELGRATSVSHLSTPEQLHLMALMPAMIVSNSSFAWWGAWLGDLDHDASSRLVVAPKPWLASSSDPTPTRWLEVAHPGFKPAPN